MTSRTILAISAFSLLPLLGCQTLSTAPVDPSATHAIASFVIPQPAAASERFMVIGDMGTGRADQHKVAAVMSYRAERDGLDFILTVGDNFYEYGVESVDDPQWQTSFENVYDAPALQVAYYPSLGNHDHRGNTTAQIAYGLTHPQWHMTGQFYTFTRVLDDGTTVQFFAVDTEPINTRSRGIGEQLEWLDATLSASTATWKIVYGHHPLYGHNPIRGHNLSMKEHLGPLLVRHGVDAYFAGHDHTLEMNKPIDGVHHVISGAAAGPDKAYRVNWTDESYYVATGGGFTVCTVDRDKIVIEFVRMNGKTQYAHVIRK